MKRPKDLSTSEAAEELGVSIKTVQHWMAQGRLSGWRTAGGHRRVSAEEVRQLALQRLRDKGARDDATCCMLVIEDDPDICRLYEIMCRQWTLQTVLHFAHDGMAGLIAVGELHPDFVVVDLNIPKVDGYELIRTLSRQFDARTPHHCVVTGMPKDEITRRGTLPSNCPVLGKPIDFSALETLAAAAHSDKHSAVP